MNMQEIRESLERLKVFEGVASVLYAVSCKYRQLTPTQMWALVAARQATINEYQAYCFLARNQGRDFANELGNYQLGDGVSFAD